MKKYRLSQWARDNGYTYQGAYEMYARGQLPNAKKLPSGSIIIEETQTSKIECTVIYARVSSPKQKDDLTRQVDRLSSFCAAKGYVVSKIYKEVASGLNDSRPKLLDMLSDDKVTRVVVENKDRLTRFGFNYIEHMLKRVGVELVVINSHHEQETDLIQDFVSVITSMAARVYGARRGGRKTKQILEILTPSQETTDKLA